jgi:endonuclease YncB( thermonuclease family)
MAARYAEQRKIASDFACVAAAFTQDPLMIRRIFSLGLLVFTVLPALGAEDERERRRDEEKKSNWWRTYDMVEFPADKFVDGDSFHLLVPIGRANQDWSIRLYGVDCAETDQRFPERLAGQAKAMGLADKEAVVRWGEKAKARTVELLKGAKQISLHVKSKGKEKTRKEDGQDERYYGIVELLMPDGKRELLHKILLKEGLALSGALQAPWPPEKEHKEGEEEAREEFERENKRTALDAKKAKKGFWGEKAAPGAMAE